MNTVILHSLAFRTKGNFTLFSVPLWYLLNDGVGSAWLDSHLTRDVLVHTQVIPASSVMMITRERYDCQKADVETICLRGLWTNIRHLAVKVASNRVVRPTGAHCAFSNVPFSWFEHSFSSEAAVCFEVTLLWILSRQRSLLERSSASLAVPCSKYTCYNNRFFDWKNIWSSWISAFFFFDCLKFTGIHS